MINLYLLRHGQSKMNEMKILQGQKQFPKGTNGLTEKGKRQVEEAKKLIKNLNIDLIFSSDIERCEETAQIIYHEINTEIIFENSLREQNCGGWEGFPRKEIFDEKINKKQAKEIEVVPPNGESLKDIEKRVIPLINKIINKYDGKNILFITHGAVIQTILGYYLKIPFKYRFRIKQKAGGITHIKINRNLPPEVIFIG